MIHLKNKWQTFRQVLSKRGGVKRTLKLIRIVYQEKGFSGLIKQVLSLKNELRTQNELIQWQEGESRKKIIPERIKYQQAYSVSLKQDNTPLISIILVNFNGLEHLKECLDSIARQTYPNLQVIIVDNGSIDGSVAFIQQNFPQYELLRQQQNIGFSKAVNRAAEQAKGRYFCLFNNDMVLDEEAVTQLQSCLSSQESIGAVGSKIRFYQKFITIKISNKKSGKTLLDLKALKKSLKEYPKLLFTDYLLKLQCVNQVECHEFNKQTEFKIPLTYGQTRAIFRFYCTQDTEISISTKGSEQIIACESEKWVDVNMDLLDSLKHAQWVINNAGSFIETDLSAGDQGFGLYDEGQFDQATAVEALCGGALLLRPEILGEKAVFSDHFFAYYEDTDLSFRIRKAGYKLSICPQSVVYHKHASTSNQNPELYKHYTTRNRLLFIKLHYPENIFKRHYEEQIKALKHARSSTSNEQGDGDKNQRFQLIIDKLLDDIEDKLEMIENNNFY